MFILNEKDYSKTRNNLSVGIANISSIPGNLEQNKKKIIDALDLFTEKKTNLVIFPEYSLSGYFWEPEKECQKYMKQKACLDQLLPWIDEVAKTYVNETMQYIVFSGLKKVDASEKYFNINLVLDRTQKYFDNDRTYKKTFLPGSEKQYLISGVKDSLVLETEWGKFGFLTCYDICFPQLFHELAHIQNVDGIIVTAAWRKQGKREYKELKINEDAYYQVQWNVMMQALACQNQAWVMAANAVGAHTKKGLDYCGNSGIWAPSGINMIKGSDTGEELMILNNIDIIHEVKAEKKEFCFTDDFKYIHPV